MQNYEHNPVNRWHEASLLKSFTGGEMQGFLTHMYDCHNRELIQVHN